MNENRKKIILNEIQYWKQNKMLPEQYCDYLLTLYSGGNPAVEKQKTKGWILKSLLFLAAVSITVFVIYFTELSFILQIAFLLLLGTASGISFIYFLKKGIVSHLSLILTAFLLLMGSVEIASDVFSLKHIPLAILVAVNCLAWLIVGKKLRILYFFISGIAGLVILTYFIFV